MGTSLIEFGDAEQRNADQLIQMALEEDLAPSGDITSLATIPIQAGGTAHFVGRACGVLGGLPVVSRLIERFQPGLQWRPVLSDGDRLERGSLIAAIAGPVRSILALERIALNFLQRLSGIATLTARFVAAVEGTGAAIYDTRKTTPGWRALEKYAVRCGGGRNHRLGLHDAILIKDNHLAYLRREHAADSIGAAIAMTRAAAGSKVIEIEVDSLDQLDRALRFQVDIILLDNFAPESLAEAVGRRNLAAPHVELEASGGVTLQNASALARSGVDRISVGALTHSAPALDVALDFVVAQG